MTLPAIVFDKESIRVFAPAKKFAVYRLYNSEKELLYIGATGSPRTRLLAHLRSGKPATTASLEFFRNSTAMAKAEARAIKAEPTLLDCGFGRRHAAWNAQKATRILPLTGE